MPNAALTELAALLEQRAEVDAKITTLIATWYWWAPVRRAPSAC